MKNLEKIIFAFFLNRFFGQFKVLLKVISKLFIRHFPFSKVRDLFFKASNTRRLKVICIRKFEHLNLQNPFIRVFEKNESFRKKTKITESNQRKKTKFTEKKTKFTEITSNTKN